MRRGDGLDSLAVRQNHGITRTTTRMAREAGDGRPGSSRKKGCEAASLAGRPPGRSQFETAPPVRHGTGIQSKMHRSQPERWPPAPAQTPIRHLLGGIRAAAGAPERRLRNLPAEIQADALRRSLPQDRQGARSPVCEVQYRTWPLQGRSKPDAKGRRLSRTAAYATLLRGGMSYRNNRGIDDEEGLGGVG